MTDTRLALPEGFVPPKHIAIIMDGNGRWAKQRGLPRTDGHIKGQEALRRTLRAAADLGVQVLTAYAFSTENWNRPEEEVAALMGLLVQSLHQETSDLLRDNVRLMAIGDLTRLPHEARLCLEDSMTRTAHCTGITLVIALSYSSRDELRRAFVRLAEEVEDELLSPTEITEEVIDRSLDTASLPPLDLLIRTGGEQRISNFLLWQAAYAELYFSDYYWPDFGREALVEALLAYTQRERRFGLTSEQLLDDAPER